MTGTAKTVLIVAGAGVGVFVLLKLLSPSPLAAAYGRQPPLTGAGTVQGLIGLGNALKGIFGGSSSSSSPGPGLSAGDKQIFDTVTDKSTGAVDLSGVYDNSGIVDTLGG